MAPQQDFVAVTEIVTTKKSITKEEKILQQQLVLILHAHNCQVKEILDTESTYRCNLPYCQLMKDTINHIRVCVDADDCNYTHCESSRQLISHYKSCVQKSCFVCAPVRRIANTKLQPN